MAFSKRRSSRCPKRILQRVRACALVTLAPALAFGWPGSVRADAPLVITQIAGDGSIGHVDGPAASASFMMPAALAYGPDGTLYVADEAAQRIRTVSPSGIVATLAGSGETNASGMWVDGGDRDGPAAQAQFNRPDGIAVASDGTVYVADLGNACIRAIAHGEVRTLVKGMPSPRSLTLDREGALYVADWKTGVFRVAKDGTTTPIVPAGVTIDRPTGIVVGNSGPKIATLFVGDARGLVEIELPGLAAKRTPAFQSGEERGAPEVAGDFPFGVPHAIAAYDATDVVFCDLRDSSVKYFRLHSYVRYLGETPPEDAPLVGGGPDGADGVPRFDAPMGVAIDAKSNVAVADAGNRRVVRVASFDRQSFITAEHFENLAYDAKRFRIALVGSSFTWYFTSAEDSIAGRLAGALRTVPALANRPAQGKYFQIGRLPGEFDLIDNVLSLGTADLVVLVLSPIDVNGLGLGSNSATAPVVRAGLLKNVASMGAAKVPFVIALLPAGFDVSPLESRYLVDQKEADEATDYESEHASMLAVLAGLGVPTLDLYPAFRNEIASPSHRPLYFSGDVHLTEHGRELVASELARFIAGVAPWGNAK